MKRLPAALAAVLCLGLAGCVVVKEPATAPPCLVGPPSPALVGGGRADAVDDVIVVRKGRAAVTVLERQTSKVLWAVAQRPNDAIVKARLARGSIVTVRESGTVEVFDLKTGKLRFAKEKAAAVGVSWTMLYVDSAQCQPDCLLRAIDLETGQERWTGPQSLRGNVMVEPGEPPDGKFDPPGGRDGTLRAPDAGVVAVRAAENVILLDAGSGRELSRMPVPEGGIALGSHHTLLQWRATNDCKVMVAGHDAGTGEVVWQVETDARPFGQPAACAGWWLPHLADGLFAYVQAQGRQAKVIEVDSGAVVSAPNSLGNPLVAVDRRAIITYAPGVLAAVSPREGWRLWRAETAEVATIANVLIAGGRLAYTSEYPGSPHGVGWVRDLVTGKRLWYADGATPLGFDGDRVIFETSSGEVRLERLVSTG